MTVETCVQVKRIRVPPSLVAVRIAGDSQVVDQGVQPDVDCLLGVARDRDAPPETASLAGHGEVWLLLLQPLEDVLAEALRLNGPGVPPQPVQQLAGVCHLQRREEAFVLRRVPTLIGALVDEPLVQQHGPEPLHGTLVRGVSEVDPVEKSQRFTTDGLRYFLLRQGVPDSDCDYNDGKVLKLLNAELAHTLGGLLNRCTARALNPAQHYPPFCPELFHHGAEGRAMPEDHRMLEAVRGLPSVVQCHYESLHAYKALEAIGGCVRLTNGFVQRHALWKLDRDDEGDSRWLDTLLHVALECLRTYGILLQPVVPEASEKLLCRLGVGPDQRSWAALCFLPRSRGMACPFEGRPLGPDSGVLFSRLETVNTDNRKPKKTV
ncbi:hypothetical protein CRUP_019024 [Coryphaenoides rupestris]|nr:hypothetical protein CRUP_019024 [Coryphaenoides rupestris]